MKYGIILLLTCCFCLSLSSGYVAEKSDKSIEKEINVALSKWGATVKASSEYRPGFEALRVLDGRWSSQRTDQWNSAQGDGPHWLSIDLGAERTIHKIVIRHAGVFARGERYNTADFVFRKDHHPTAPGLISFSL